jgi:CHAT domain-containing protein/Tfp pilus assembly protein PilF
MSGELAKAMESYLMALDATEELYGENHAEVGLIYNNIGTIHYLRGDYGQAADFFNRAGDLFLESFGEEHPNVAGAYNNAAVIYIEMGNLERGSEILERAQQIKEKTLGTNNIDTAIGYSNLAHVYEQMGNNEKALENLQKSLRIRRQIYGDNHPSLVDVHRMTGDFYSRTGDQNSARDHYQSADTILRDRIDENHPDRSDFQFKIGRSFQVEGNLSDALSYFQLSLYGYTGEAITSRDEFDLHQVTYPRRFLNLLRHLGDVTLEIYEEEGREALLFDSHYYYRWAADVMHVVQTGYASEDSKLNLIEEYHSIFDQAVRVSHHLFEITGEQQWLDEILWFSEAGRSRVALELLNRAEARNFSGVPDSLVEQERKMSADIARFTQQIHEEMGVDNEENNDRLVAFRDSLFTARQNLLDFIQDLERRFPTYYQLKYDRNYADRGDIIDFLHENEVLVSYSVLDGEVSALIISSEGSEYIPLGPSDSLEEDVRAFNESVLVTEDRTQFIRLGRKLYSNLVEPVMKSVDAASVIIIPDGPLHYLPFDMLLTDNAPENGYVGMPYLVRDLSISHSPSATLLQKLREREQKRGSKLFAMAPFVESGVESDDIPATYRGEDTLSSLPLSGFEVRQIASVLSVEKGRFSGSSSVFTGRDATSKKLLSANLREFDFIHFATHAFINEEIPELSGILLNESDNTDGTLYVNDIYTLDLNADLVVLSACETGLGTHIRGEGIIGFTRAFLYAGASGLLVSLWRVNDQPTAELMVHFYEQLREEKNYGEALREAKLKLISKPQFAAPKNWAPFVLQGSV